MLQALLGQAKQSVSGFEARQLTGVMWACAHMEWELTPEMRLCLEDRALSVIRDYDVKNLDNHFWAYKCDYDQKKQRREGTAEVPRPSPEVMARLGERAIELMSEMGGWPISNMLSAHSKMRVCPSQALVESMHAQIISKASEWTLHAVTCIICAYASLTSGYKANHGSVDRDRSAGVWSDSNIRLAHPPREVTESLEARAVSFLEQMDHFQVGKILYALEALGSPGREELWLAYNQGESYGDVPLDAPILGVAPRHTQCAGCGVRGMPGWPDPNDGFFYCNVCWQNY